MSTLVPLSDLSLKIITYKLVALVALTTAARAQTLSALDIRFISEYMDKFVFQTNQLLKTSRPGVPLPTVVLYTLISQSFVLFVHWRSILVELSN